MTLDAEATAFMAERADPTDGGLAAIAFSLGVVYELDFAAASLALDRTPAFLRSGTR